MTFGWEHILALVAGAWLGFVAAHEIITHRNNRRKDPWP